jgi:hypothetical protein
VLACASTSIVLKPDALLLLTAQTISVRITATDRRIGNDPYGERRPFCADETQRSTHPERHGTSPGRLCHGRESAWGSGGTTRRRELEG